MLLRVKPRANQDKEIRFRFFSEEELSVVFHLAVLAPLEQMALLSERGYQSHCRNAPQLVSDQKHSGIARVDGKRKHPQSDGRYLRAAAFQRPKVFEQLDRPSQRFWIGWLNPVKGLELNDSGRLQVEKNLR